MVTLKSLKIRMNRYEEEMEMKQADNLLSALEQGLSSERTVQITPLENTEVRRSNVPHTVFWDEKGLTPNEVMRKYQEVPPYGLSFIFIYNMLSDTSLTQDDVNQIISEIKSGDMSTETKKKLDLFVNDIREEFDRNGVPKNVAVEKGGKIVKMSYGLPYIRKNLLKMKEEEFINVFAPGIGLSSEDVEAYLLRVFRRTCLDTENYKEVMLYIAQKNYIPNKTVYQLYSELCKYYEQLKLHIAVSGENRLYPFFIALTDNVIEEIEKSGAYIFNGQHCTDSSIHPLLKELLVDYCKSTKTDYAKVQNETFQELWNKVLFEFADEVYSYKNGFSGMRKKDGQLNVVSCEERLILDPPESTPGCIMRTQRAKRKSNASQTAKENVSENPENMQEKVIENEAGKEAAIVSISADTYWTMERKLGDKVKGRLVYLREKKQGEEEIPNEQKAILVGEDIEYKGIPGTYGKAKGKLNIKCYPDMYIPKGTRFKCYDAARNAYFYYETVEEYSAVPVSTFCEYLYLGWCKSRQDIDELNYIERCNQIIDVTLFDEWIDCAQMTNQRVGKFEQKSTEQKRNFILTLLFLQFNKKDSNKSISSSSCVRRKFIKEANVVLQKCGFALLHNLNQFDLFLLYMFGMKDSIDAFREVWAYYLVAKKSNNFNEK